MEYSTMILQDLIDTLKLLPASLVGGVIALVLAGLIRKERTKSTLLGWFLGGTYLGFIAMLTLISRRPCYEMQIQLKPFETLRNHTVRQYCYYLENILFFVPVGVFFSMMLPKQAKWYRCLLVSFGLSLMIELLQLATKRGCFQTDDLVANVLGGMLGFGIYCFVQLIVKWRKKSE